MNTTINLTFTKITFYNAETEKAETTRVEGKLTVKECKEFLFDGCQFITKSIEVDTFEVNTQELIALRIETQEN